MTTTEKLADAERAEFEAAYTLKLLTIKDAERTFRRLSHTPDEYEVASVHAAWVMWQHARAALAATPAAPQDDEESATVTILRSWLVEADASCERLVAHLRGVLEIARTWQPDYATHMDKETLRHAEEALNPAAPDQGKESSNG